MLFIQRHVEYKTTRKPAESKLYWTSQATEELAILIHLVPLDERGKVVGRIETIVKAGKRECVNLLDVTNYFAWEGK